MDAFTAAKKGCIYDMPMLALLLLTSPGIVVAAQQPSTEASSASYAKVGNKASTAKRSTVEPLNRESTAGYVLGAGDQISIHVLNFEEINDRPIPIDLSGRIHLPLVGELQVSGNTVQQLEAEMVARLKKYVLQPDVSISVTEFRSQPVSVLGAVKSPGVQQVQGRKTILEMLSLAGGLDPAAGATVKITRQLQWGMIPLPNATKDPTGQFSVAEIRLKSLIEARHPEQNILVKPNDVISVPRAETVYVIGEVQKTGGYVLNDTDDITVLQALSMAGGLSQMARPKEARILRKAPGAVARTEIPVDISKMLGGRSSDVRLQPDDILFVPNNIPKRAAVRAIEAAIQIGSGVAIFRPY